jgi:hypothetical protein
MGSFFDNMTHYIRSPQDLFPHAGDKFGGLSNNLPARQVNPNGGAYAGVAPSLAGANAGYGGAVQSGANQYAAASAVNPYAYAASQATKSTGS